MLSPLQIIFLILGYFGILILISRLTGKKNDNASFFLGNRKSPWFIVAFGMIGTSLSGVTFISVPGWVEGSQFAYMQIVLGYFLGYAVIALALMPLYYRLNLTSIYTYLEQRFGVVSYKTGAFYFLLSRTLGASARLYLVAIVLQAAVFDELNVPFAVTVAITILLIWVYTFQGGIKTIIWTDTLQTFFLLAAVGVTIYQISSIMGFSMGELIDTINNSGYSKIFFFEDYEDVKFFPKQLLAGFLIAICMTGLDQDMMQKNLSCKSLGDAQKNMFSFSAILVVVNLLFLGLGALLYMMAAKEGLDLKGDKLYGGLALGGYLGPTVAIFFILGLIAAAYSSADSALTALTTSFCVDFLNIKKRPEDEKVKLRMTVHIGFSVLIFLVILLFTLLGERSIIDTLLMIAGYTYGPLLGLYAFGMFTKFTVEDKFVWLVCLIAPVICLLIQFNSEALLGDFAIGSEILALNGALTFLGLYLLKTGRQSEVAESEI